MHQWFEKSLWAFFIALFLAVQGLSLAHATENGGEDHTHEGIACDVAVASVQQTIITPPVELPAPTILPVPETGHVAPTSMVYQHYEGRAPPLRGPPL